MAGWTLILDEPMEMISLKLYGNRFAEYFVLSEKARQPQEMRDDACMAYIVKGAQEITSPTQTILATKRESILLKCGNYITTVKEVTKKSPFMAMVFHFTAQSIVRAFGEKNLGFLRLKKSGAVKDPVMKIGQNHLIDSFVKSMQPYFEDPTLATEALLSVKLQEIILILSNGGQNALETQILTSGNTPENLDFARTVESNLYNNLSISELAHLSYKSESTFKRDFKKHYGESPAKYFKTKKLAKAVDLLTQTVKSVGQIAFECGFENQGHFSTSFSDTYGKSPKKYQNELK